MKVFLITQLWPDPPLSGESVITYNLIKELNNIYEFHIFSIISNWVPHIQEIKGVKSYEVVNVRIRKNIIKYITSLFKPFPYGIYLKFKEDIGEKLKRRIEEINPDIIVVCSLGLAMYYRFLPYKIPKVLLATDSLPLVMKRLAEKEINPIKKLHYMLYYRKAIRYEQSFYKLYDSVVYVSEVDADEARRFCPNMRIEVINNGVDTEKFKPIEIEKIPYSIGFTGNLGYIPNERAAYTLCTKIYSELRKEFPQVKIYIIGVNPSVRLRKLHDNKNIFVTGYVDNIVEYLNKMEIYCSYLEAGGGIKNKILEAMSVGLPVVGTSYSFEGIEGINKEHFVVVDSIESTVKEIQSLFKNKSRRIYISSNARRLIVEKYSWKLKASQYARLWERLIKHQNV